MIAKFEVKNFNDWFNFKLTIQSGHSHTINLRLLFLVAATERKPPDISFVYIDEFDAFYHHKLSRLTVESLSNLSAQVILTTHSTSIINNGILLPDCYFLMGSVLENVGRKILIILHIYIACFRKQLVCLSDMFVEADVTQELLKKIAQM